MHEFVEPDSPTWCSKGEVRGTASAHGWYAQRDTWPPALRNSERPPPRSAPILNSQLPVANVDPDRLRVHEGVRSDVRKFSAITAVAIHPPLFCCSARKSCF